MFQRRQSLRNLFGNGRKNATSTSTMALRKPFRKKKNNKKKRDSFRQSMRDRRKYKSRLQHCMEIIEKHWNPPNEYSKTHHDKDGNYKISTPDGRFHLLVSGQTAASGKKEGAAFSRSPCLSISTCIYTCTSDVQSTVVMKKALELNDFVATSGYHRKGYALSIDPRSPDKANPMAPHQSRFQPPPIKINLCFSRPMISLFTDDDRKDSNGDDEFFASIKDFVKVAFSVQTKLESVDEGRLGIAPRLSSPYGASKRRVDLLTNPPSILARLMGTPVNSSTDAILSDSLSVLSSPLISPTTVDPKDRREESLLSAAMAGAATIPSRLSVRRRSSTRRNTTRRNTTVRKIPSKSKERIQKSLAKTPRRSTRNILSQFSSPEEARVFELYSRLKSKRKALKNLKQTEKNHAPAANATITDAISGIPPPIMEPIGQPPKRMASLPISAGTRSPTTATTHGISSLPLEPPALSDWNKTPVISNKRMVNIQSKNHGITTPPVLKKAPLTKKDLHPKTTPFEDANDNNSISTTKAGKQVQMDTVKKKEGMSLRHFSRQIVSDRHLLKASTRVGGSTRILV